MTAGVSRRSFVQSAALAAAGVLTGASSASAAMATRRRPPLVDRFSDLRRHFLFEYYPWYRNRSVGTLALMLVASGGHHGPGNGPASLVAAHPELKDGTLLILNLEHVAYADVVRGKVRATNNIGMSWETSVTEAAKAVGATNESPFLVDLWKHASRCYGVATYQSAGTTVSGDLGGYRPLGVPMTQVIQSGTFYHSSGDVYEAVRAEGLERAARFHAFFVEKADQAPEQLIAADKGTPSQPAAKACP